MQQPQSEAETSLQGGWEVLQKPVNSQPGSPVHSLHAKEADFGLTASSEQVPEGGERSLRDSIELESIPVEAALQGAAFENPLYQKGEGQGSTLQLYAASSPSKTASQHSEDESEHPLPLPSLGSDDHMLSSTPQQTDLLSSLPRSPLTPVTPIALDQSLPEHASEGEEEQETEQAVVVTPAGSDSGTDDEGVLLHLSPATSASLPHLSQEEEVAPTEGSVSELETPKEVGLEEEKTEVEKETVEQFSGVESPVVVSPPSSVAGTEEGLQHVASKTPLTLILLGKTGNGKSSTGNTILGRKVFKAKRSASSVTTHSQAECVEREGRTITVIDTPGLFDTSATAEEVRAELSRAMALAPEGVHAVLLVLSACSKFTSEEKACVSALTSEFGEDLLKHCVAVFTHGDELEEEETGLDEFLEGCPQPLQVVLDKLGGRKVVFNNRAAARGEGGAEKQVEDLMAVVEEMVAQNNGATFEGQTAHVSKQQDMPPVDLKPQPMQPPSKAKPSDDEDMKSDLSKLVKEVEREGEAELAALRMAFRESEAARRELERQVRDVGRLRRSVIIACSACGVLVFKLLLSIGGGRSRSFDLAKAPPAQVYNMYGPITWSFEPNSVSRGVMPMSFSMPGGSMLSKPSGIQIEAASGQ